MKSFFILISFFIITGSFCIAQSDEERPSEYSREGSDTFKFFEGPHVIYDNDETKVLQGIEQNGQMVLKSAVLSKATRTSISVYKSGFLPRRFDVLLKGEINQEQSIYPASNKIFALSDIEGNFNTMINLLQQHGVINDQLSWTFGAGHFVIVGDVFDRGNHVTEMLWLIYKLEAEAQKVGGHVHLLLGNHEAMNLRGDLRYIEPKYAEFAKLTTDQFGLDYVNLFGKTSELGRWLRTKNVIEKIGDNIFVHAGLSPELAQSGYSIKKINELARKNMDTPKADFDKDDKLIWGKSGPFWYRGYFDVNEEVWGPRATQTQLEEVLAYFEANRVVVGHSHVEKPEFRYEGKVCGINVKPPADHMISIPPMKSFGILIKDSVFYRADGSGGLTRMEE